MSSSGPPRASAPPRPSSPSHPHAPRPWKGAWRVLFAFVWVTTQITLVITADRRPDAAFGFRMFSESSTLKIALYREVTGREVTGREVTGREVTGREVTGREVTGREVTGREDGQVTRVHVDDGVWSARTASGGSRNYAWRERVRRQELATFDTEINAKYAVDAQLARLQAALDDLAAHVPDDVETRRFLLDVTVRKNGREPYVVHLASGERLRRPSGGT